MRSWWLCLLLSACASKTFPPPEVTLTPFREARDQVDADWSPDGKRIAYTLRGADGFLDIHLADPDGRNDVNLTAHTPGLPRKHVGAPAWHPDGRSMLVVAEKPGHAGSSFEATPGFAGYSDLWLVSADGKRASPLTDLPNDRDHGVLFGDFSPDGKQVVWAERIAYPDIFVSTFGTTVIRLADFVAGPTPHLANVRTYQPGGKAFYEVYGFSPDGRRILFCSQMGQPSIWDQHIYTLDIATGEARKLTEKGYNEHAVFTPDGKRIIWMTNAENSGGTDWWIMNADGSGKRRLTYMNERGHPHDAGESVWAGLVHFSPDGRRFIGGVQTSLTQQVGRIVIGQFH